MFAKTLVKISRITHQNGLRKARVSENLMQRLYDLIISEGKKSATH